MMTRLKYDPTSPSCLRWTEGAHPSYRGKAAGTVNHQGYYYVQCLGKLYRAHRVVYELHNGPIPEGLDIDHINGERTDNRIENLRACTRSQNLRNRASTEGRELPRNVYQHKGKATYYVRIKKYGRPLNFGSHKCLEFAELVARCAREKYFGEYGTTR